MNANEGMSIAEARVMALGYSLINAFDLLEEGDSIEIVKIDGKAVAKGEPEIGLVAYLLNGKGG
jgi:hypothetical protein